KDINDEVNPDDLTETANIQEPDMPLVATMSTNGSDKDGAQKKAKDELEDETTENDSPEEEIEQPESPGGKPEEDTEDGESNQENEAEKDENEDGDEEEETPGTEDDETETPDEDEDKDGENEVDDEEEEKEDEEDEETPEKVEIINNHMHHEMMSPLISNGTEKLIHAASDTVSEYQRMLILYESYFGLDMDRKHLWKKLRQGKVTKIASKDSLHYLFNKKEVADLLEDYMVEHVTSGVTAEDRKPVERLQSQIHTYKQL